MTSHKLDLFSLLSGLVLVGIALAALFGISPDIGPWVWPTVLIAVGVVVLTSVLRSSSGEAPDSAEPGAVDDPPDHHREDPVLEEARAEVEAHEQRGWAGEAPTRDEADRPT